MYESAALNMPANLENSTVATGLEKVSFHSNPKERQCQRMFKRPHNCTHLQFSSVHFSCSVVSDSLRPHESQNARPPCPSQTPRKIPWRRKRQPTPVLLPGKSMDGGAWRAAVHGVTKSQTRLSDFTFFHFSRK